ncbi:MAG: nucleotidyltransferase domain-containing protein [Crocosphaera sp.]|nr:nucleotidyltransferase domain-containing protein [Crocosphaera sp.]
MNLAKVYKRLKITPKTLAKFCQENQIKELAVFGSILRNDFNEKSDIDLLVSYQPTAKTELPPYV